MSEPRQFAPIPDADWPETLADLAGGFATKLNVYRVMAHHPALLSAWANLRDHVVVQTHLGAQRSEIVILRTGVNLGSSYEWGHHVSRARALGMADARIASIQGAPEDMCAEDAILANAVDMLFADKKLSAALIQDVIDLVGETGLFDLIATVGFYSTLGYMLNSFDTPLDAKIAEELSAQPLPEAP